jgi:hypothetical protein
MKKLLGLLAIAFTVLGPLSFAEANRCVIGTRCDNYYGDGSCRQWAEYRVCGVFCATGRECDNFYGDRSCRQWRTTAACGSSACASAQVCASYYGDGSCREWGTRVSCY